MNMILNYKNGLDLTDNDEDLYNELLSLYLTETIFDVKILDDLILKSKEEAASYIHKIKGSSRQIGAELLAEKGQQIEDILRNKAQGSLPLLINEFCKLYTDTRNEIINYKKSLNN